MSEPSRTRTEVQTETLPLTGRCHCGATTYEVSAMPSACVACHCHNCQRISGSAFSVNFLVPVEAVRFTGQAPAETRWVADSGNERAGKFCSSCGSRLLHGMASWEGMAVLRTGTLDDTSLVRPVAHIWLSAKQDWVEIPAGALQYPEMATDREAVAARYASFFDA